MADPRFFERRGPFSLQSLAEAVGGELDSRSDPRTLIHDVAPLDLAGPDEISFLNDKRHTARFSSTAAGACLVARAGAPPAPPATRLVHVDQPYLAFIRLANLFHPEPALEPGLDPQARIDPTAAVGEASTTRLPPPEPAPRRAEAPPGAPVGPVLAGPPVPADPPTPPAVAPVPEPEPARDTAGPEEDGGDAASVPGPEVDPPEAPAAGAVPVGVGPPPAAGEGGAPDPSAAGGPPHGSGAGGPIAVAA